ncbi:hypothetical protein CNMCM8980_005122 [Aspergillus fumigatiaffinis]|uniref:Uncharacterized protein n=1 Tax=Aspergillus fumigatiaffinis TaxID=340414 RepID=A0A8H4HC86_9EURO|nr:hypothetical protein CNMCM6805_010000 [Aspergillus fumigatiaffinis]KAF4241691.1 hypothetical protein CNMCM6457_005291 [Aspergillus fumigatiaffinis]KAF4248767.1 hypothetical protein CNMCM8980_005122 [Aspergillus fumigatiaffinis]
MVGREKLVVEESSEATPLLRNAAPVISAQECRQHKQLLRCFLNLKQTVSKAKGLFKTEYVHEIKAELDPIARQSMMEERRWSIYVSRAIRRFSVWWTHLPALGPPGLESSQLSEKPYGQHGGWAWTRDELPPLDVLMVLHALTLHTKTFGEDCFRHQKMALWNEGFPLQLASRCIDQDSLTYSCPESCRLHFENMTKLAWDNLGDPEDLSIECFRCQTQTIVPWTTRRGKGLADNGFVQLCQSCKFILRRDSLLVQKLRRDLHLLSEKNIPLPGTCWSVKDGHGTLTPNNATNELVKQFLGKLLLEETRPTNLSPDMTQIIEASTEAVGSQSLPMLHDIFEQYQYVGNSSCDLYAAIMRVSKSASMMHNVDWFKSELDLSQIETRYVDFLRGQSKGLSSRRPAAAKPDLMDSLILLWSTHLLAPRSYWEFFRRFGNGVPVDWKPPHDSATCNLCHTMYPPSFARRFIRGLASLSEWKEWLSTV